MKTPELMSQLPTAPRLTAHHEGGYSPSVSQLTRPPCAPNHPVLCVATAVTCLPSLDLWRGSGLAMASRKGTLFSSQFVQILVQAEEFRGNGVMQHKRILTSAGMSPAKWGTGPNEMVLQPGPVSTLWGVGCGCAARAVLTSAYSLPGTVRCVRYVNSMYFRVSKKLQVSGRQRYPGSHPSSWTTGVTSRPLSCHQPLRYTP